MVLAAFASVLSPAWAAGVPLGTAADFGALAGSAVTNTGSTVITGSVGVWAGTAITGFPPGLITPQSGSFHSADVIAQHAQSDLTIAYDDAAGRSCNKTIAGDQLGGLTLPPGVYCLGAANLTGTLTLDGPGVYIFQMASSLITASNSSVSLINGASACDVFWQVTSSATLGTGSAMAGTIMALASITMDTGATLTGAALARTGQVTLQSNNVSACESDSDTSTPNGTTFRVVKYFDDDNPMNVEVTLNCFSGLPLTQSQEINANHEVVFVVNSFTPGELDCDVEEVVTDGYSPTYWGSTKTGVSGGITDDEFGCHFEDVQHGQFTCAIVNTPKPVEVVIEKMWVIDGSGGDEIDGKYKLVLHCNDEIVGGNEQNNGNWKKTLYNSNKNGTADTNYTGMVIPDWDGGTSCWVDETVYDSSVEVTNGCTTGLVARINTGDSCVIVNTVYFEGIPTLSQYGLALMALLMLGVGLVGFRRLA